MSRNIVVSGAFDDLRSAHFRFLDEAAKLGELTGLLWPDDAIRRLTGQAPKLPQAERLYFLSAIRYVSRVEWVKGSLQPDVLPDVPGFRPDVWVVGDSRANAAKEAHARARGIEYRVIGGERLMSLPDPTAVFGRAGCPQPAETVHGPQRIGEVTAPHPRKKVVVTGCYDWWRNHEIHEIHETKGGDAPARNESPVTEWRLDENNSDADVARGLA